MSFLKNKFKALAGACLLIFPIHAFAQSNEPIKVVASFSILADIVQKVGGEAIDLAVLVGGGEDVHTYFPTPADAKTLGRADILFVNGLEFEEWLPRLVEAADFDGQTFVATAGITPIGFESEHHDEYGKDEHHDEHGNDADHDEHGDDEHHDEHGDDEHHDEHGDDEHHDEHGDDEHHDEHGDDEHHDEHGKDEHQDEHGKDEHQDEHGKDEHHDEHGNDEHHDDHVEGAHHAHGALDPHAWHSVKLVQVYVSNIAKALAQTDPSNAVLYQANSQAYLADLEELHTMILASVSDLPENKRTVVTSHDAFGYFEAEYGIKFLSPQGLSTESDASAQDVADIIRQIRSQDISAVFVESISDPRLIQQITSETDATVGGLLYSGALSGLDGSAATYTDMMRYNVDQILKALK